MVKRHKGHIELFRSIIGIVVLILMGASACAQNAPTDQNQAPIKIGVALSLSGDFSQDGKLFKEGYQLWADHVNKNGGLLGRQVQMDVVDDASKPEQVTTSYQKLITVDHVDLVFGPFSSLLTKPASKVAERYGYAFPEGAGVGPSVFTQGRHNLFCVSLSAENYLLSFANYILSLPAAMRPKTVAYATEDDPFTQPQVDLAKQTLESGGIRTLLYDVYPAETTDYTPIALKIIRSGAQMAVLGTQTPDGIALIEDFKKQHYNPQAVIATSGPDQPTEFSKAIGIQSTEGVFVPNGWWPGYNNTESKQMVQDYLAQHSGMKASDVSSDIAQAYSVGQVVEQAVKKVHSLDNKALIQEMHADPFNTVQGPVKFDNTGQNSVAVAALFQWQKGQLIPVYPQSLAAENAEFPKPQWQS